MGLLEIQKKTEKIHMDLLEEKEFIHDPFLMASNGRHWSKIEVI